MLFQPRDIAELSAITTAAANDPKQWRAFLARAASVIGPVHGHILGFSADNSSIGTVYHGYDDAFIDHYLSYYAEKNPWAPGWIAHPEGTVLDARQMYPDDLLVRTEWYADWIKPQDDLILGGGSVVAKSPEGTFLIGANFPRCAGTVVRDNWLDLLRILMPQLQSAWRLTRTMVQMKLGGTSPAILIVRPDKRLAFVSDEAAGLLENGNLLALTPTGRIAMRSAMLDHWLDEALWQLSRGNAVSTTASWAPTPGGPRFRLSGNPMDRDLVDAAWPFAMQGVEGLCLLLVIKQDDLATNDCPKLCTALGLTIAEAEVVIALTKGHSLREIAEHRRVSLHTVRSQVKSAMFKSQSQRQTQLVTKALAALTG